jgi:predicted transcriptional regulator
VLETLKANEVSMEKLSKLTRIPAVMLKGVVAELKADGYIEEKEGVLKITDSGIEAINSLKEF